MEVGREGEEGMGRREGGRGAVICSGSGRGDEDDEGERERVDESSDDSFTRI